MAETIKIGGELESVATGNVVAAASAIKDKVKNKYQSEINAETDTSLADRYTKAETYNKTELNNMITTPNQKYVSVTATAQTTAVTDVLPVTGAADTTYRVGNWDGTQYNDSVFSEYAWNGSAYVKLDTKSQIGEVYDISANHADTKYADLTAALGENGANIPQELRRGGMSVKYVQTYDNKYVQYRLMADSWSTNTENWAIAEEGVYVDNPEFVYVKTDKDDKILWAIKKDGGIYYGAGVPQQVIDYIEEKLADLSLDEYENIVAFLNGIEEGDKTLQTLLNEKVDKEEGKSLIPTQYIQEIENPEFIKAELDVEQKLLGGIKKDGTYWFNKVESPTLDNLQNEVNDAIEESQEALIEHYDYYNVSKHHTTRDVFNIYTANTGWQQVEYDSTAAMYDELDVYQIGEVCNYGEDTEHSYEAIISQRGVAPAIVTKEYVTRRKFTLDEAISLLPAEILTAFAAGQMICFTDIDNIVEEWQLSESGSWVRVNPYEIKDTEDRVEIKLDNDNKIIAYRKSDGTWVECVGIEAPNLGDYVDKEEGKGLINSEYAESVDVIEDPEGRNEITLDSEDKIVSYRKEDGTKVENVGIETNHLELTEQGMSDFQQALKDAGFQPGGGGDWSERETIELPEPKHYSLLNLILANGLPMTNTAVEGQAEYYDGLGNYFKLGCSVEMQGQTSQAFAKSGGKGNYTLDIEKDIKFGSWVPQDSFHLKGCAKDVVRAILPTSYKWAYIMQGALNAIPNRVLVDESGITETSATGERINDWPTDARCLPDGFPCELYVNGEYWGLYSFQLKKHRKNYSMDKKDYTSCFLDADDFGMNNANHGFWNNHIPWTGFDIKGPKDLVCMDGSAFDGDHPQELIDSTSQYYDSTNKAHRGSATTKAIIQSFPIKYLEVKTLIETGTPEALAEAKVKFNEYFDYNACVLVYIYNCLMKNGDSVNKNTLWGTYKDGKIFPALWDLDAMYGHGWVGITLSVPSAEQWTGRYATDYWPLALLWSLYKDEIKATYAKLRRAGVISLDTWKDLVFGWCNRVGEEAYNRDIKRWPETPSYRKNYTNTEYWEELGYIQGSSLPAGYQLWSEDSDYSVGDEVVLRGHPMTGVFMIWVRYRAVQASTHDNPVCPVTKFYDAFPQVGGLYDSPKRWEKWMNKQLLLTDVKVEFTDDILADFTIYRNNYVEEISCLRMSVKNTNTIDIHEHIFIEGHITRHEREEEGQTISYYTIDSGRETDQDTSKTYTTVMDAVETASSQQVEVPSESVFYIEARAKDTTYYWK